MSVRRYNVLIVAAVFKPEPIVSANLLYELAVALSDRYMVTVLRPTPTRPLGFQMPEWPTEELPFELITLDSYTCPESKLLGRFRESRSIGKAAVRYIDAHHNEIDFIFNDPWHLFGVNLVAKAAVKYGIKYITPVQDIYPESLISKLPKINILHNLVKRLLLPIDKYNLRNAETIHTISEKMVDILSSSRGIPKEKFIVVRNWQDDRQFTEYLNHNEPENRNDGTLTLMYLGNVGWLAGLEIAIDAMKLLPDQNIKLVIAGSGPAKSSLMERAADDNRISFIDVHCGAVPATQAKADIMLLPVKRGFALSSIPSKLPAYMFSAKPVLASVDKASDTAKCILDCDGGWVIEPESPELLASKIKECLKLPLTELRQKGEQGREYALKNLSRDQNLSKLVNACINIIEGNQI